MPNEYLDVASLDQGATTRVQPHHKENIFRVRPDAMPALSMFNALTLSGNVRDFDNQEVTCWHEWPFEFSIKSTATYTAGATTITVDKADMIREGQVIMNTRTRERMRVTADPTSTTSITVKRATGVTSAAAGRVGDKHILMAASAPENWDRQTPVSREPESHTEYIGTWIRSTAASIHKLNTQHYGGVEEVVRVRRQFMDEFDRELNRTVLFSEPYKDTATATKTQYHPSGLFYYGLNFNRFSINGGLTMQSLFAAEYLIRKLTGENAMIGAIGSQRIVEQMSMWAHQQGIVRVNNDNPTYGVGSVDIKTPTPGGAPFKIAVDYTLDEDGVNDKLLLVNWKTVQPMQQFSQILQQPNANRPQGVADIGTGTAQWQIVRSLGIYNDLPAGSVVCLDGIKWVQA